MPAPITVANGANRNARRDLRPRGDCLPMRVIPLGEDSFARVQGIRRVPYLKKKRQSWELER
jgi:hypothetical protein